MMNAEQLRICVWLALVAVSLVWGCADEGDSQVNSQTHWLSACETDADCAGEYDCLCGVCTIPCDVGDACASEDPAQEGARVGYCVTPESSVGLTLCDQAGGGSMDNATGAGLCLTECDPSRGRECPEGLLCADGACVGDPNPTCEHAEAPADGCDGGGPAEPELDDAGCIIGWACLPEVCDEPEPVTCADDERRFEITDDAGCVSFVCRSAQCSVGEGFLLAEVPVASMEEVDQAYARCAEMADECGEGYQLRTNQTFPSDQGLPVVLCECACADPNVEQCSPGDQFNLGEIVYDDDESLMLATQSCLDLVAGSSACKGGSITSMFQTDAGGPQRLACACICPDDDAETCHRGQATPVGQFEADSPEGLEEAYFGCQELGSACAPGHAMEVIGTPFDGGVVLDCVCMCNGGGVCEDAPFPARDFCEGPAYPVPVYDNASCVLDWTCVSRACPALPDIQCDPNTEQLVDGEDAFGCPTLSCEPLPEVYVCGEQECLRGSELCYSVAPGVEGPTSYECIEIPQECFAPDQLECSCLTEMIDPSADCDTERGETHLSVQLP